MKRLQKKLLRDMKANKAQFINIFLMIFLAIFAFSGVHSYMDGMKVSADEYYAKKNLQDLWVSGNNFSAEDIEQIKNIENVNDAERILTINTTCSKEGKEYKDLVIQTNFIESNNISKMTVIDGEGFDKDKSGIWFDKYLADNLNIKVGEEVTLTYEGMDLTAKILGLVETPDHVYFIKDDAAVFPTHKDFGFVYLSAKSFPIPSALVFPQIIVDVKDTSKINEVKAQIEDNIPGVIAVTDRQTDTSYVSHQSEVEEGETYSKVFTAIFVFIAILSVVTTMNRFVKRQRTQIGTLKALGFTNRRVIWHYVSYGLTVSGIAAILGVILGNFVIGQYFIQMEYTYYEMPIYHTVLKPIIFYIAIAIVVMITFVTYLSCIKVLKEPAAEALRIERPKVKVSKGITTTKLFRKLSLSTKWNLRDIARSKARTLMALAGIVGCTMLVVCALGMKNTMQSYISWGFETLYHFKYKVALLEDYTEEEFNNLKEKYGDSTSQTVLIEFKSGEERVANVITVNDSDGKLVLTDHNKKSFELESDGIYVTERLAKTYDWKIGDIVEWHILGENQWQKSKIIGFNRDPQAQQFNCTRQYFEATGKIYRADALYTNSDLSDITSIPGVSTISSIEKLKEGMTSMLQMMDMLITLLIVISAILAYVILLNLGTLSYTEKEYQFATMKVLGFDYPKIKKIFIKQNIWITVLAILMGLPLGYLLTDYIFKSALSDKYDFPADIKPITYILAAIGTFTISYVINQIVARKLKKIDMVSSLKANE